MQRTWSSELKKKLYKHVRPSEPLCAKCQSLQIDFESYISQPNIFENLATLKSLNRTTFNQYNLLSR